MHFALIRINHFLIVYWISHFLNMYYAYLEAKIVHSVKK